MEPFSADDFTALLLAQMPTGAAWPRDLDAVMPQVMAAMAPTYARLAARDLNLLTDAFPVAPVELLPEWEATLGLPDPCAGVSPTIQQRQQQVNARFIAGGGQSVPYFINVAAALGYPITITEFAPSRFGTGFGQPFGGPAWAFVWQINAPTFVIEPFLFGRDGFGEPFTRWGSTVLQCEMQRLAPAETTIIYDYT